jgi:hypothetical protein
MPFLNTDVSVLRIYNLRRRANIMLYIENIFI